MRQCILKTVRYSIGWLFGLALLTWSSSAFAQDCGDLEGEALTACLTVLVCLEIEENKARNQCLEVVRQILEDKPLPVESVDQEIEETEPKAQPTAIEESVVDFPAEQASETTEELVPQPEKLVEPGTVEEQIQAEPKQTKRRWMSWLRLGRGDSEEKVEANPKPALTIDGVPKEFAAKVVSITKSGYNDALLVLDNRYVFIVNRVTQSRIEEGDVIVAQKKEGLSGRHSFLFYGRGASVDAQRIDCQHVDPSRQTRRRCEFATKVLGTEAL